MRTLKEIQLLKDCVTVFGGIEKIESICEYGDSLESMLRDRLVCGVNHDRTQQRLLSEGANLTLQKAMDISLSLESAIRQSAIM